MIEVGDKVPFSFTVRNAAGTPVDAAGGVVVTITLPDLTQVTPTVDHVALSGIYSTSYVATVPGLHRMRAVATDPVNGQVFGPEPFTVEESLSFISLDEALTHLQGQDTITSVRQLENLRRLCAVACDAVERDLNRWITPRTVVETYNGGGCAVVLNRTPVAAVTSVVDGLTTLTAADYTIDERTGILYRGAATTPTRFAAGRNSVVITYRAGYLIPPMIARQVALRGVQRMWQAEQLPHPALDDLGAEGMVFAPAGVLTPLELAAYMKLRHLAVA